MNIKFNNKQIEEQNNIHKLLQLCKDQEKMSEQRDMEARGHRKSNALENLAKAVLDVGKDQDDSRSVAKIKF